MVTRIFPAATIVPKRIFENVVFPKRICIDLDGVICEYNFPKIVKGFFGVELSARDIFAYDLADVLGVSHIDIDTMFQEQVYGKPIFLPGAIETLKEWQVKNYKLAIFSNRVKYMGESGLMNWLIDWQVPFTDIDDGKGIYDIHIDDSPSKLMATDSKIKLLYSQPWNERCLNITGKLRRVKSWQEINCLSIL